MAIRGLLREAALPDVLQLLAMGKKTGCLSVTHRQHFGSIYFDRGRICYASIVNRRDRLGDLLVRDGLVSRQELDAAIEAQGSDRHHRLGEILVQRGLIAREQLNRYIRHQIEEAVYYLFTWTEGTFSFEQDVPPDQDFTVSINPESLLLEGARRVDEWSLIEKKVPSFDCVFALDRFHLDESDVELTAEQDALLPLIDGRRDVTGLVDASGLDEFEVGKALYGLAIAGFLHRVGRSKPTDSMATETRSAEHRNLGVAFYRTGMYDEAAREFRRVTELHPGDYVAEFYLGLVALRQGRIDDAVRALRLVASRSEAGLAAHLNLAYALERAGRMDDARQALRDAERMAPDDPMVRMALGVFAFRTRDVAAADAMFRACLPLWQGRSRPAAFFHYAGLAAAMVGEHDRAIAILEEGVERHPHAAVLLSNLAAVYERRGRHEDAMAALERAALEDAVLPQVHKNSGDLLYRAGRYEEALESYQRAVRYDAHLGGDVYLKLGNIRYRRRERDEAMRCWERSLALAPDNPMARNNLETARRLA